MRVVFALLVPLAAALLQGAVVPLVPVGGARPNLPLLVAGAWSVANGARDAVWWAFIGGVVADLLSGGPLGALALASLPGVAAIGLGERRVRPAPIVAAAALIGAATLLAGAIHAAIVALAGSGSLPPLPRLAADLVGGAVYTGVLAIAVYPVARAIARGGDKQPSFA